jgi:hypothetical protein
MTRATLLAVASCAVCLALTRGGLAQGKDAGSNRLRQGYGGPPELQAKAEDPAYTTLSPAGSIAGPIEMIRVQGQRAYVTNGSTLTALDLTTPGAPKPVGSYTFPERIWGLRVVGSSVFVSADRFGLGIVEFGPNGTATLRGSVKTPGQAKSVSVSGGIALVTDFVSGLDVIDIANPSQPVVRESVFLEGLATDVVTSGSFAYAADRPTGFYVFDLSKRTPLEPIGSLQSAVPNNTQRAQLEVIDNAGGQRIVVLVAGGLLQLFDVSTPSTPAKLPPFKTPGNANRIAMKGTIAYVADGPEGIQMVDLANPSSPRIVASFKTSAPARDVVVSDSFVFVGLASGDVTILRHNP